MSRCASLAPGGSDGVSEDIYVPVPFRDFVVIPTEESCAVGSLDDEAVDASKAVLLCQGGDCLLPDLIQTCEGCGELGGIFSALSGDDLHHHVSVGDHGHESVSSSSGHGAPPGACVGVLRRSLTISNYSLLDLGL